MQAIETECNPAATPPVRQETAALVFTSASILTACGGGGSEGGLIGGGTGEWNADGSSKNADIFFEQSAELATPMTVNTPTGVKYPKLMPRRSAARFLVQATFGVQGNDIDALCAKWRSRWIDEQFEIPPKSSHYDDVLRYQAQITTIEGSWDQHIWESYATAPDQLRKRVGFALSQIMVVSVQSLLGGGGDRALAGAAYFDWLEKGAFGNFRDLLNDVTLSPAMGWYLSTMNNNKALYNEANVAIRVPDENYAREVMQLFTIGTIELNIDGNPKNGVLKETYNNTDIQNLARVFTGWRADAMSLGIKRWNRPMIHDTNRHSPEEKKFLGVTIPAKTPGVESLKIALDTLFNHPNVGPFIGRQLIQRLVTSNPSPGYIERVARKFNDNGRGVRGDMRAVIKAILLDPEAISPLNIDKPRDEWGKLREPVLRFTQLLRMLEPTSKGPDGIWGITMANAGVTQHPGRAPSVFNFFDPNHSPAGTNIQTKALYAPEFQIASEVSVISVINYFASILNTNPPYLEFNYQRFVDMADKPVDLIATLNLILANESLAQPTVNLMVQTIELLPKPAVGNTNALLRVKVAILMVLASPEYLIQK
ncbi:MAG: DUF1800 domain-containing protein [Rhodoferax sp.]|nr:DUF1800 domain-containing protein [Rhodoferax sp.]